MLTLLGAASRRTLLAGLAALTLAAGLLVSAPNRASAQQEVSEVEGSAYGYFCDVVVFSQGCDPPGPAPEVTLPPGGSATPITATQESAFVTAGGGVATIFSSGPLTVSTEGTTGPSGSVTSSAEIQGISGDPVFDASNVTSTCTANEAGTSGSTTITGGTLQIDSGDSNPNNDIPDHPAQTVPVPSNPDPNTTYEGHVHVGNVTDDFRYVFNEQVVNADGSLTVRAAHQYFGTNPPDNATGNLIIGEVVCGVTLQQTTTTTTVPDTTTTTGPDTTTTTGPTTTTTGPTTTTTGPTTTTTGPTTTTRPTTTTTECKPGYGYGDPNHCHSGPPGLEKRPTTTRPRR